MKNKSLLHRGRTSTLTYHLLSLPAILMSGAIILVPAIQTMYSAFTEWNGISSHKGLA